MVDMDAKSRLQRESLVKEMSSQHPTETMVARSLVFKSFLHLLIMVWQVHVVCHYAGSIPSSLVIGRHQELSSGCGGLYRALHRSLVLGVVSLLLEPIILIVERYRCNMGVCSWDAVSVAAMAVWFLQSLVCINGVYNVISFMLVRPPGCKELFECCLVVFVGKTILSGVSFVCLYMFFNLKLVVMDIVDEAAPLLTAVSSVTDTEAAKITVMSVPLTLIR
eukprot:TRINITY_DN14337_c0_g1_i1.p1 TRINITY_DN14337_c0_g1~~TRINITY_DN14337_c0_g1_i1.p1  ORF type:complete len:221 (-),score=36.46 TRINITY_DN14337_c0_g1_i1:51-713(-)